MNTIIKQMTAFVLSLALIFASTTSAYANTSIGGWSVVDTVIAGANTTINAVKTSGGKAVKSAITIAPQAGKVGKVLVKGFGVGAVLLAVSQVLGDGVDYVLDPANNTIRYKSKVSPTNPKDPMYQHYWIATDQSTFASAVEACKHNMIGTSNEFVRIALNSRGDNAVCYGSYYGGASQVHSQVNRSSNSAYDPSAPTTEEKTIPIPDIAARVISNAAAGDVPSQEAVKAAALEGFASGEHDAALDAAAEAIPDTGVENPPVTDPANPPAENPPFDDSGIISAINSLKAMLTGILSSIAGLSDFFKSDPPVETKPEDTALDIPIPDIPTPDTDINFSGSCPANFEFNGSIFGNPINIVLLDTSKFCGFLSTFVKFPVYAASSLFALYILGGRKDA